MDSIAGDRAALLEEWLAEVLRSYPSRAARQLADDQDPFRNPAGHTLRHNLAVLLDAVLSEQGHPDTGRALEDLVRLRAVQDFTAAQAVAFLLPLKPILARARGAVERSEGPPHAGFDDRIDRLLLLAFDLYVKCREKMFEITANETKRQTWLLDRMESARRT